MARTDSSHTSASTRRKLKFGSKMTTPEKKLLSSASRKHSLATATGTSNHSSSYVSASALQDGIGKKSGLVNAALFFASPPSDSDSDDLDDEEENNQEERREKSNEWTYQTRAGSWVFQRVHTWSIAQDNVLVKQKNELLRATVRSWQPWTIVNSRLWLCHQKHLYHNPPTL